MKLVLWDKRKILHCSACVLVFNAAALGLTTAITLQKSDASAINHNLPFAHLLCSIKEAKALINALYGIRMKNVLAKSFFLPLIICIYYSDFSR